MQCDLLCVPVVEQVLSFQPDVIIAIGGGSPMDAAKVKLKCLGLLLFECLKRVLLHFLHGLVLLTPKMQIMWLLYEHPEVTFEGISARFMDIRKRVYEVLWRIPEKFFRLCQVGLPYFHHHSETRRRYLVELIGKDVCDMDVLTRVIIIAHFNLSFS